MPVFNPYDSRFPTIVPAFSGMYGQNPDLWLTLPICGIILRLVRCWLSFPTCARLMAISQLIVYDH